MGAVFEDGLHGAQWVAKLLGGIDVKRAQISFVKDRRARLALTHPATSHPTPHPPPLRGREYIVGEVAKLEGGMGAINSNVMGALRERMTTKAKALLQRMPTEERGTSVLINNVAEMLKDGGRLAEASCCCLFSAGPLARRSGPRRRRSGAASCPGPRRRSTAFCRRLWIWSRRADADRTMGGGHSAGR